MILLLNDDKLAASPLFRPAKSEMATAIYLLLARFWLNSRQEQL